MAQERNIQSMDIEQEKGQRHTAVNGTEMSRVADSPLFHFFSATLKRLYWAEQQLLQVLPKLEAGASSNELMNAISTHFSETKVHVQRLEKIFTLSGQSAKAEQCLAMQGLLNESEAVLKNTDEGSVIRDLAILLVEQRIEHYEVTTYGSLVEYTKCLGLTEIHDLLEATLQEEKMADLSLTLVAQQAVISKSKEELEKEKHS